MIQCHTIQAAKDCIVEVVQQYVQLKRRGATYVGLCPFHDEHTPSFHVHPAKNIYKCFGCGAGGDAIEFIKNCEQKTFGEAVELIAGITGISMERTERTQPKQIKRKPKPTPDIIPLSLIDTSTPDTATNSLTAQIAEIVSTDVVKDVLLEYRISLEAGGFINYPQIDITGKYRTGKSIQYKDGYRTKYFKWTHDELKKNNILPTDFKYKQCFTGEHLISTKPIAIVEGQSTMLFMAALGKAAIKYNIRKLKYFAGFTWIATGGSDGIGWKDEQVMEALKAKDVLLFPDAGFYQQWSNDAELMQEQGIRVGVSLFIEGKYKTGQLKYNEDIRDYLMLYANDIKESIHKEPLIFYSTDIMSYAEHPIKTKKGYIIKSVYLKLENGNGYDIILDENDKLVRPGDQHEPVEELAILFNKKLQPAMFDGSPCWVHLDNSFIVNNN